MKTKSLKKTKQQGALWTERECCCTNVQYVGEYACV